MIDKNNSQNEENNIFSQVPMGLGMGLCKDMNAMNRFATLDEASKQRVIDKAKNVRSKSQMQSLVNSLGQGDLSFFD